MGMPLTQLHDGDWLRGRYITYSRSLSQVAAEVGCGVSTVHRWLHRHGIAPRDARTAGGGSPLPGLLERHPNGTLTIPLLNRDGEVRARALIDEQDANLADVRWYITSHGYVARREQRDGRRITRYLHREVAQPGASREVDHFNGDRLDNRRANLRIVTRRENGQNVRAKGGASPHRGVSLDRRKGRWYFMVALPDGTRHRSGLYATDDEAAAAARAFRLESLPYTNESRSIACG